MRFIFTRPNKEQQIIVPTKIDGTHNEFHQAMLLFSDQFHKNTYNGFLFDYTLVPKRDLNTELSVKFTQYPTLPGNSAPRRYLGPKGIEIRVFFTDDNKNEAQELLERFLSELPITEKGAEGLQEVDLRGVYQWYMHECEQFSDIEKQINELLKDAKIN